MLSATLQCAEVVCSKAGWPATKLPKSQLVKHVQEIWDTYFAPSATFEICISMTMRRRVVFRLKHLHLYGKVNRVAHHVALRRTNLAPSLCLHARGVYAGGI